MLVDQGADFLAIQRRVEVAETIIAVTTSSTLLDESEALGIADERQRLWPRHDGVEHRQE